MTLEIHDERGLLNFWEFETARFTWRLRKITRRLSSKVTSKSAENKSGVLT